MPEIEYIVNADHAEAINGKLYLHGAGWADLQQAVGPTGQRPSPTSASQFQS